eukprot:CAMPEP_0115856724 /NCGR_PEP_ID=MMETSP0287-20121206/15202_1 /TAXON_ID=412157 /ORGANISM="Chrysochromulina rotalis, Strain UIO044" /LENGTH=44 /DNA_ID= /DNA_START= /DNA_END= /DNA_ORIENTATION=
MHLESARTNHNSKETKLQPAMAMALVVSMDKDAAHVAARAPHQA